MGRDTRGTPAGRGRGIAALAGVGATTGAMPVRRMSAVSRDGELATYPLPSAHGAFG